MALCTCIYTMNLQQFRNQPYGKIWAAPYWNMGKVWMLFLTQIMAKSMCPSPQILYCQWWLLNSPKYVLGKDYVELLDFDKIWRIGKIWLPNKWQNQCATKILHPKWWLLNSPKYGLWPFITISAGLPSWWSLINSCASTHKERSQYLKTWHLFTP